LLRQVLDIFVEEAPKHLAALRVAIRERSAVTAEKHAHTLKGEVGYFKVPAISEKAAQLEAACRGCEFDSAQNTLPEFEAAMHRLIDSVLSCIQSGTGSST
jgi:HPt (histidine-containing phosphotransfer) domain-containing protein